MGFPVGSVIVLYNNEGSNNCYNFVANETGAGGQFFIPVGTSTLMESTSDSPTVQGTPDCDYYGATYTTPGTWGPIGLGNTADGLQVRCPGCSDEEPAMFQAISYGTGFGTVAMGTNDLGGMFSSGTGTQQTYSYTFSTCITSCTPGTWTRTTAASAGTPPDSAGVVSAAVRTQLESCSIPCCGGFEEQPDEEAVAANGRYRFGFNGMEKDDEVYGATGTSYTTEFRGYDPRIGRWWSVDPESSHPLMIGISPYGYCYNNPTVFVDKEGDLPIPLITGIGGALGAGIYGLVTGKSGKEIGALMVGGFVAGATMGLAPVAVAGMGGMAAIGGSSTAMIYGGAGIAGNLLGNGASQGLKVAMGMQDEIDENEVLMSGVLGIYDPMLGGAASHLGQPARNAFSSFLRSQTSQEVSAKARSTMIKSVAGDLKAQSSLQGATLSDRKASRLAGKLVDEFIGFVDEMRQQEIKVVDFTINLFENGQGASINAILEGGKGAVINATSDEEE